MKFFGCSISRAGSRRKAPREEIAGGYLKHEQERAIMAGILKIYKHHSDFAANKYEQAPFASIIRFEAAPGRYVDISFEKTIIGDVVTIRGNKTLVIQPQTANQIYITDS